MLVTSCYHNFDHCCYYYTCHISDRDFHSDHCYRYDHYHYSDTIPIMSIKAPRALEAPSLGGLELPKFSDERPAPWNASKFTSDHLGALSPNSVERHLWV